ncbi:MAG: hypothetical protein ACI4CS_05625 [Candidatus Weimeria sp.]
MNNQHLDPVSLKLRKIQNAWRSECLDPFYTEKKNELLSEGLTFSGMFYCDMINFEDKKRPKLMVIGQETKGWGSYEDDRTTGGSGAEFAYRQLYGGGKYNSPFWHMMRRFSDEKMNICYNNLNKVQYDNKSEGREGIPLAEGDMVRLSKPWNYNGVNKSLLLREIECINPDVILLVIGNKDCYVKAMSTAMGAELKELAPYYHKKNGSGTFYTDITEAVNIGKPVFWSYHPNYLQQIKVIEELTSIVIRAI